MPPNRIQNSLKPVNVLRNYLYKQRNILEDGEAFACCSGVLPVTEVKFYVKAAYAEVVPRARQATSVRRSWSERDPSPAHSGRFQQRDHTDWSAHLLPSGPFRNKGQSPLRAALGSCSKLLAVSRVFLVNPTSFWPQTQSSVPPLFHTWIFPWPSRVVQV